MRGLSDVQKIPSNPFWLDLHLTLLTHASAAFPSCVAEPETPNTGATVHGLDQTLLLSEQKHTELKAAQVRFQLRHGRFLSEQLKLHRVLFMADRIF